MSYLLKIEIPGLPKTPNDLSGGGWRRGYKNSKEWKALAWSRAWPYRPPQPLKKAKLTLTRCSSSKSLDFDNLAGSFKPVIDGLVRANIIVGDSPDIIGRPEYRLEPAPKGKGKIKIVVEEI